MDFSLREVLSQSLFKTQDADQTTRLRRFSLSLCLYIVGLVIGVAAMIMNVLSISWQEFWAVMLVGGASQVLIFGAIRTGFSQRFSEIIHPGMSDRFVIEVVLKEATAEQTDRAAEEILKLGATVVCLQQTLLIYTSNKETTLEKTLKIFKNQGLTSVKINVRNRSLEDLFIKLKGMMVE